MAQHDFDQIEKEAFVQIYMDLKNEKPNPESTLAIVLSELQINLTVFKSFKERELSDNDKALLSKIKVMSDDLQKSKMEALTIEKCKSKQLNIDRYRRMLALYKSDISFQQELLPIFSAYLKQEDR